MAITISGTTGVAGVDGSASAPSVAGTDSNSGVYFGADTIKFSTGGTERLEITNSGVSGGGKILQVVNGIQTAAVSRTTSSGDWGTIMNSPAYSVTRSGTKSLVLVTAYVSTSNDTGRYGLRLYRWSSTDAYEALTYGDAASSRIPANMASNQQSSVQFLPASFVYLDTHGKAAGTNIQYNLYTSGETSDTIYLNRTDSDTDSATVYRTTSTMTVMEVDA